jgi:lipopolysaccharide export system protein LptA
MIACLGKTHTLAGLALLLVTALAAAQEQGGALQGLSMNRDQPVKIESNSLEVRDKQREATFAGGVTLTQGETVLKCKTLVVFYEDTAMASGGKKGAPAQGAPQAQKAGGTSGQQIKRAEARGDVLVTQKDQTASGDHAVYDLKANTIVMTGNVVLTQGPQVLRGGKMVVELATGLYRFEGRVDMLVMPGAANAPAPAAAPGPAKDAKAAQPQPAKSNPRAPIKIN